jgi:hypothetical protein
VSMIGCSRRLASRSGMTKLRPLAAPLSKSRCCWWATPAATGSTPWRPNDLWLGSLAIAGFSSGYYFPAHPDRARPAAQGAIKAISQGLVDIRTQVFPLAEAAEAHRRAENGSVGGRILLAVCRPNTPR